MRQKQNFLPRRIQHRHKHQGNQKFALLSLLTSSHFVKLQLHLTLEPWMHTGRQRGSLGAVVRGRPVESAWLLHSERKRTILPWSNSHGKHGLSKDDFEKIRKYEKNRLVQKNHRLLNTPQISFYHCTALLLSGPKHEYRQSCI